MKQSTLFLILAFILLCLGLIGSIYYHEMAHLSINNIFGVPSHYAGIGVFNGQLSFGVQLDNNYKTFDNNYFALAHSINEVVGYQLLPFFFCFGTIIILGIFIFLVKKEKEVFEK